VYFSQGKLIHNYFLLYFNSLNKKLKASESKLLRLKNEVGELKAEKAELQKSSLEAYEEGFQKVVRQVVHFSSSLDVSQFDLDKDVVDDQLVDD